MSKYLLNKFLFTVDRDADLVERYREDPSGFVGWWEETQANRILNVTDGGVRTPFVATLGTLGVAQGLALVITGGAQGIGKAIAVQFAAEGAKLVLSDIDEAAVQATAAQIGG